MRFQLMRLALWLLGPDYAERPSWLLERDPTDEEQALAALCALSMHPNYSSLTEDWQRRAFLQGVSDAVGLSDEMFE